MKKTREEILSKHTGESGIYLTRGMIRGSDALDAMQEYAEQLQSELTELKQKHKSDIINAIASCLYEAGDDDLEQEVLILEKLSTYGD